MVALPGSSINPSPEGTSEAPAILSADVGPETSVDNLGVSSEIAPVADKPKGAFRRAIDTTKDWSRLQKQIRLLSASVARNEWEVQESLNLYRLALSAVSFKSHKLDNDIWSLYRQIRNLTPPLRQKTQKRLLFLRKRSILQDLHNEWQSLSDLQKDLLDTLAKAPKSVEFYDRIHMARIKKREHEVREAEISRRSAQAKEAIETALQHVNLQNMQSEGPVLGTGILKLEDAKNYWNNRLLEINNLETSTNMDPEEIIHIYRGLESTITDAPHMAERVREVEIQFARLIGMHEELSNFGKNILPAQELSRILITVQDEVPKLWASGSWEKLRRCLDEINSFIKFYELPVRSELSLAERRKPGLTRALLSGAGASLPLSQITPLVRTLVSAIDSRDHFMAGHSDAVARLSVQIARKMNWSAEDLEYLEIASLLHDVGKILIPEMVLTKEGPLSPEDWKAIQTHPYHGAKIVKSIESLNRIAPWIYHHQEKWDGTGYPDRISSKDIPSAARIIGVGEAFTVMTSDSPKRKALSFEQAVSEISKGAGTQFDPEVAGALTQTIETTDPKFLL